MFVERETYWNESVKYAKVSFAIPHMEILWRSRSRQCILCEPETTSSPKITSMHIQTFFTFSRVIAWTRFNNQNVLFFRAISIVICKFDLFIFESIFTWSDDHDHFLKNSVCLNIFKWMKSQVKKGQMQHVYSWTLEINSKKHITDL